jgi:hypothetical protein
MLSLTASTVRTHMLFCSMYRSTALANTQRSLLSLPTCLHHVCLDGPLVIQQMQWRTNNMLPMHLCFPSPLRFQLHLLLNQLLL